MKLTKSKLKQIIKEELEKVLKENPIGDYDYTPPPSQKAKEEEEAIKLGFVDPYDDGLRKHAGMMAYKRWVAAGRPERGKS